MLIPDTKEKRKDPKMLSRYFDCVSGTLRLFCGHGTFTSLFLFLLSSEKKFTLFSGDKTIILVLSPRKYQSSFAMKSRLHSATRLSGDNTPSEFTGSP